MTFNESYQGGHMGRALPGLTPGVKVLLIANLIGFVINNLFTFGKYITFFGLSWEGLTEGYGLGLLRVFSYQFVHSLSLGHIIWNMLFLFWYGSMVERGGARCGPSGRSGLIKLYLLTGILGGLVYMAMGALISGNYSTPVVGASGAVYGIMMYAACIDPRRPINLILFTTEIRYLVGFLVFVGLYYTYIGMAQGDSGDGTAHSAHLGGALGGYLCFKFGLIQDAGYGSDTGFGWGPIEWWRRKSAERAFGARQDRQATLDQILQKISDEGMSALTAAERRFLEKVSKQTRK